jgi:RNA polymerase sigma-70 factor (sigma-E family)
MPALDNTNAATGSGLAANTMRNAEDDFREFVTERWSALVRTAYLLTGSRERAEDLVQSALVRAHRHWPKIQREGTAEAYLRKTMTNLNTDWWRRLGSHERGVDSVPERAAADDYAAFELRDELWGALQQLPARMRAALVLRYFEDLSEADTASALGCSVGSVKSQCSRGLARLRLSLRNAQ